MDTRVLVVEDDVEINELLGEYLSLEDIKYLQALSGQTAIRQAVAAHPDAMILDLMLPDIDGYQVAREVAAHRRTFDIPIIMLTCMNQACDREKGLASGAHRYMNKPFLPDDLLANVRSALEWKKSLQTRPPQGRLELTSANLTGYHQGVGEMIRDLFARTRLSDCAVGQIREGFVQLAEWALEWGKKHQMDPHLHIDYRITDGDGKLSTNGQAAAIGWEISEPKPGLLEEMLFKPAAATILLAVHSNGKEPLQVSPLAKWYQFLAKCGIARFDKDTKTSRVRLERPVVGTQTGVPVVVMDGARVPTRVLHEAVRRR